MRKITNVTMTIDYTEVFNFCNMYQALDFIQLYIQGKTDRNPRINLEFEVNEVEENCTYIEPIFKAESEEK